MRDGMDATRTIPEFTWRLTDGMRARIAADALAFIVERYGLGQAEHDALAAVPIRWRRARGSSAFYMRAAHGFDGPHILLRVPPGVMATWNTYRRARARFSTPPGGIPLPVRVLATAVLVHEYTHAVQHGIAGGPKRRYSEVETTENEIEYVRREVPQAFGLLVPVVRKAPKRRGARRAARTAPAAPTGLAALRATVLRFGATLTGLLAPRAVPARRSSPR
jgi:hypothetical protein